MVRCFSLLILFTSIFNKMRADTLFGWSPWKQSILSPGYKQYLLKSLPLTNQGQLPHLDGAFLHTVTKASGGGGNAAAYFLHAKRKYAEERNEGSPSTNPVTHTL